MADEQQKPSILEAALHAAAGAAAPHRHRVDVAEETGLIRSLRLEA